MPLYAFNLTLAPISVPSVTPALVLPASNALGWRGPTVNLTSELTPDLTVDPIYGKAGGLLAADYTDIQVLVAAGDIEFEWVISVNYSTATLAVVSSVITPALVPAPSSVPVSDASGYLNSGWTSVGQTITVGKSGSVDFTSVKDACDHITALGDATSHKPYSILVNPGEYTEDPFTVPVFTTVVGTGGPRRQRIVTTTNTANFITVVGNCGLYDLSFFGPTGVGFASVFAETAGTDVNIRNCGFGSGYYGIHLNPTISTATVNIRYCFQLGSAAGVQNFLRVTGFGNVTMDGLFLVATTTVVDFYFSGPNVTADVMNGSSHGVTGVFVDDSATVTLSNFSFLGGTTAIWVGSSGTSTLTVNSSTSPALAYTHDLKVDSVTSVVRFVGGAYDYTTGDLVPGADVQAAFVNNGTIEGFVVWGELLTGDENGMTPLTSYTRDSAFSGHVSGGEVTRAGGLTVDVTSGSGYAVYNNVLLGVTWTGELAHPLTNNATNYVYIDINGDVQHSTVKPSYINNIHLAIAYTSGGSVIFLATYMLPIPHLRKSLHSYHEDVIGPISVLGNAATINGGDALRVDVDSGTFFVLDYEESTDAVIPITFTYWYRDGLGGWVTVAAQTHINVLKWDNAGVYDDMVAGRFRRDLLYVTGTQEFHIVLGQTEYADAPAAVAAGNPISPDLLVQKALRVGAVVVGQGAAAISSIVDQRPKLGQFAATAGAISNHSLLSNLNLDGHPQYLLSSGTRALAGNWSLGTFNLTNAGTINGVTVEDHDARHISGAGDEVDGDKLDIDFIPTSYVRDDTDPLAPSVANLTAHLKGIDNMVGNHDARHITGGSDIIDGDQVNITFVPSVYTRTTTAEAPTTSDLTAHLKGLDLLVGDHDARHITGGLDVIDGDQVNITFVPSSYTRTTTVEAPTTSDLTAHLKGLDLLVGDHDARHITGGSDVIDGDQVNITFVPSNYTRTTTVEAPTTSDLTAHLKGLDLLVGDHDARHITGGLDVIDGDQVNITFVPSVYTRTVTVEAPTTSDLTAHLKGLDVLVGGHSARHINTGADVIDADRLDITFVPTGGYTRTVTAEALGVAELTAHLKGIELALPKVVRATVSTNNLTNGFVAATDLSFAMEASGLYIVEGWIRYDSGATNNGARFSATGPAAPGFVSSMFVHPQTSTGVVGHGGNAYSTSIVTSTSAYTTNNLARIDFLVRNGINAGTFQLVFASEGATGITVQVDSIIQWRKVN